MNGDRKLPMGPLVGELIQIAGGVTVGATIVGLCIIHHWSAAVAAAAGVVAYFTGRHLRQKLY